MKDYEEKVLNIMDSAKVNIIAQLNKAYKSGYEDAKSELGKKVADIAHEGIDKAYQRGLEDAWEYTKKMAEIPITKREFVFDLEPETDLSVFSLFKMLSIQEVIAKIKEYEEKQKQDTEQEQDIIKVGDEVQSGDTRYIVVRIRDNGTFEAIGACGTDEGLDLSNFHKTGRHFPQISEAIAEMRKE